MFRASAPYEVGHCDVCVSVPQCCVCVCISVLCLPVPQCCVCVISAVCVCLSVPQCCVCLSVCISVLCVPVSQCCVSDCVSVPQCCVCLYLSVVVSVCLYLSAMVGQRKADPWNSLTNQSRQNGELPHLCERPCLRK